VTPLSQRVPGLCPHRKAHFGQERCQLPLVDHEMKPLSLRSLNTSVGAACEPLLTAYVPMCVHHGRCYAAKVLRGRTGRGHAGGGTESQLLAPSPLQAAVAAALALVLGARVLCKRAKAGPGTDRWCTAASVFGLVRGLCVCRRLTRALSPPPPLCRLFGRHTGKCQHVAPVDPVAPVAPVAPVTLTHNPMSGAHR